MFTILRSAILAVSTLLASALSAQVATGAYPYGTFDSRGPDTINVGNLNVHLSIPVVNKPGRGMPFYYNLAYDSSIWTPASVNGVETWNSGGLFGWTGDTQAATGYISYKVRTLTVEVPDPPPGTDVTGKTQCIYTSYNDWTYHDQFSGVHPFSGGTTYSSGSGNGVCGDGVDSFNAVAQDGSGYSLAVTNYASAVMTDRTGKTFNVPLNAPTGSATVSDSNGNQITTNGSQYTDTLGKTAISVVNQSGSKTLAYVDTTGNNQNVTMTYKQYTVQTNFGCSGISEYGPLSNSLVDSISFADGSAYHFSYEATPGASGNVTGRLASVTLPTGGAIQYTYSGGNNGIVCADGSVAGLTRSLAASGGSAASTTTYARTVNTSASTSHTDVADGLGNHTEYDFVLASNAPASLAAVYYETNREVYQGAASGTPLLARSTCYDADANPCVTTLFALPITQIDTYETLNGVQEHGATAKYNSYGLQTEQDTYDYGGASGRGSLLSKEVWAYPSGGIVNLVSSDTLFDGSNNQLSQTTFAYDETSGAGHAALVATSGLPQHGGTVGAQRGNLSTVSHWNNNGASVVTASAYEDTGNPVSTTTPNGQSTYVYDPATHGFVTTATPPTPSSGVSLPTSATYDTGTGLPLTTTDPNGQTTTYKSYDALLRPTEIDYPAGGKNTNLYRSPNQTGVYSAQSASSTTEAEPLSDGYGRPSRVAVAAVTTNGNVTSWYQQDTCYDANGNVAFSSYSYTGTGYGVSKECSGPGDSYTYDALGRILQITHGDGSVFRYSYTGRAMQTTDENGVTRINQVDGFGRLVSVCEVSNATQQSVGPVACSQDIGATGFLTTYSYTTDSSKDQVTTITQGAQTRISVVDSLGRTVSTTEPERGKTTYSYSYNSTGLVVTRQRPKANQGTASVLTTTTTQYDALGRVVTVGYDDNLTSNKSFVYDAPFSGALPATNLKGRLSVTGSSVGSNQLNKAGFAYSYDALGRIIQMTACGPETCSTPNQTSRLLSFTYDWTGNLTGESDSGTGAISYGRSPAGEITSITNNSYNNSNNPSIIATRIANGPNGTLSYSLGNGLSVYRTFDSRGLSNGQWVCTGQAAYGCNGSAQRYGSDLITVGPQVHRTDDSILNQQLLFGYDNFNRISTTSLLVGSQTTQLYAYNYDRYGNRWAQNALQGGPSPSIAFNAANNQIITSGYAYDAAGNMTNDSFHSYTFDAEGNILQVGGGQTASYVYDALNRRVSSQTAAGSFDYVFDPFGRRMSTWNATTGAVTEGRIYWDNRQVAFRYQNETYFDHQDYLGTERLRTDPTGAAASTYVSLPWGDGYSANVAESAADSTTLHFAGLDADTESWTEHAQFRNYSQAQGRWLSPDPYDGSYDASNPQSFNRYAYVLNNPLGATDPLGLDDCTDLGCTGPCSNARPRLHAFDDGGGCSDGGSGGGGGLYCPECGGGITVTAGDPPSLPDPISIDPCDYVNCYLGGTVGVGGGGGGTAPNNGRNCSAGSASAGQYAAATAQVAALTAQFASGLGPINQTFGPNTATSAVMGQSAGVTEALGAYMFTGQTSGLYTFGASGAYVAGGNPVAQFIGSFRWSISGGVLSVTNTTSLRSLTYDHGPQYQRGSFPTPGGNIRQTIQIGVTCR